MRILYLDCGMGAAGDMLAAALLELLPDPEAFLQEVNDLGLPGVRITREKAVNAALRAPMSPSLWTGRRKRAWIMSMDTATSTTMTTATAIITSTIMDMIMNIPTTTEGWGTSPILSGITFVFRSR